MAREPFAKMTWPHGKENLLNWLNPGEHRSPALLQ